MPNRSKLRTSLVRAMKERKFIRFSRRFEEGHVRGYVLDVGPDFVLMSIQGGQMRFDGFACYRIADIRDFMPDPYAAFTRAAWKKLGERPPKKPRINVSSLEKLLLSAGRIFPLVTVDREQIDPDVSWIGKVQSVWDRRVSLLEIGPDALWDDQPTTYKLKEITSVKFGGEYELALHLVGGNPPIK